MNEEWEGLIVARVKKQSFDRLSESEEAVVGSPNDYDWADAEELPARQRPATVQFSLRVDRQLFESLQRLSDERGETFSDVVREAIARFVRSGGRPSLSNVQVTFSRDHQLLVQVEGAKVESPTNRRLQDPDQRATLGDGVLTS